MPEDFQGVDKGGDKMSANEGWASRVTPPSPVRGRPSDHPKRGGSSVAAVRVVERELCHLLRQRLVHARPALRALGVKSRDGGIYLAMHGFGHTAKLFRRHDDGNVAPLPLHSHGTDLRHIDQLSETATGGGGGEGFHEWRLAELANLGNADKLSPTAIIHLQEPNESGRKAM